ncbi:MULTISPECIES: response regulator transcription factor [unclassified Paenibacillus]|uniref:response regulator transcription factor n=1 Tax=Paenibacillus TaxID=44249 RepID=UPI0003F6663B|nr:MULTISPECIES: response regulator transcription factor [unclassified Paenibacillus]KKC46644.1 regulator [Paenibacillus sp. D9]
MGTDERDDRLIRILMVEDDPDWIRAMSRFLGGEPDMLLVASARGPEEALKAAAALDYDVVLMDIQLGEGVRDGISAAADLLELRNSPVIMLTSVGEERAMTRSFASGAVQYIGKTDYRELPAAIRKAVSQPAPMAALLKEFRRLKREEQLQPLTPSEREVYELIERGTTQAEIGRRLFKSESTLKNQVNRILKKLGARSSREAVRKIKRGDGDGAGIERD